MKSPLPACTIPLCWLALLRGYCVLPAGSQTLPDQILLKDYQPHSIFNIPETRVDKARFAVIDMHSHDYAHSEVEIDRWVKTMDEVGLEKTIILSGQTGPKFDDVLARYRRQQTRFEVWCGFDYSGFERPGYGPSAVAEIERCHRAGATGVGELSDKGSGLGATPTQLGMHIDDPRLDALLEKCGQLGLPVNIHVGEDKWMYEPMDQTNDGLMNAWKWRVPKDKGVLQHDEVFDTLENGVRRHPHTLFIACHLANCCSDLARLSAMLDRYPNLYADLGARFAELAPIPRFFTKFLDRHPDRVLYGTDMDPQVGMYRVSFRLLESADEHFYPQYFSKYHWAWYGFALPDTLLERVYRQNAIDLLNRGKVQGGAAK